MNQTSVIAAALIIAFIVFITVRGELPGYLSVFTGTAPPATSTASTTGAIAETASNFIRTDPTQYPGGPTLPTPWGSAFGSDFGFGGGGSAFETPPGQFPL